MLKRLLVVVAAAGAAIGFAGVPAAAGGGCTEVMSGKSRAVDLKALCVIPTLVRVPAGTEVTFVNRDATDHVIVGSGMTWGSDGTIGRATPSPRRSSGLGSTRSSATCIRGCPAPCSWATRTAPARRTPSA